MDWSSILVPGAALLILCFLVYLFILPFRSGKKQQHQVQHLQDKEEIHWHIIEGGKGQQFQQELEPPAIPQHPWLYWLAYFKWNQHWQYKHGWNKEEDARSRKALDLYHNGLDDDFFEWVRQREENQSGKVIEATIYEVTPDQQPEVQEEQPLPAPGQWNLTSLKAEGYTDIYKIYILGMLSFLYHRLPQSGTIHRDDNKREPGLVMGKVISQSQWDDFIGSSNPTAQKGQGLFRRAGLIVDIERESRKVTVFAHRDIGQAIDILTQYLISEQQGQTTKQKDEQSTPTHQRREDEEEKSTGDTPHPLPHFQFQEYR